MQLHYCIYSFSYRCIFPVFEAVKVVVYFYSSFLSWSIVSCLYVVFPSVFC